MIKKFKALLILVIGIILFTYMTVVIPFENPPVWVVNSSNIDNAHKTLYML
jgi:uncharacterized membrane protein YqiK